MHPSAARRSTPPLLARRSPRWLLLAPSILLGQSLPSWAEDAEKAPAPGVTTGVRLAQARQPGNAPAATPDEGRGPGQPRTDTRGLNVPGDNKGSPTGEPNGPPPTDPPKPPEGTPAPPAGTPAVPPVGGEAPATPGSLQASEAEGQEIADVRVVGNRVVPASSVLAQLTSRRGAAFSTQQIDRDVQKVTALGFFAAVQYQVTPNLEDARKVDLTIVVVENRVVTGFKFVGVAGTSLQVPEKDLLPVLSSKTGSILNTNFVNDDVAKIIELYKERGFAALVTEAPAIDASGILTFTIQEAKVSRVDILGLTKTRPSIVRRQIRIKAGDTFDQNKLRRDLNRIYDLGFFEDVNYSIDNDAANPDSLIVKIQLKERRTGQFTFGVGFDSRSRLTGFVTLAENNLRGTGKRAFASVEAGAQRTFDLGFGDPFVGKNNSSYDIGLFSRRVFREPRSLARVLGNDAVVGQQFAFVEQRTGGRFNYGIPLDEDRTKKLLFGYRNEQASLRRLNQDNQGVQLPDTIISLEDSGRVSALSAGFLRDRRDLQLDPSSGGREQVIIEQAFSLLGGQQNFTKIDIDLRRYIPLMKPAKVGELPKLVLADRLVIGQSFGRLPPFEQYFIGGPDTLRGYNIDRQFGDNQIFNNFELRYRLQKKFQIVGFVDAGRAAGGRFSSDDSSVLLGIGAGVRLQSPLGPIRLDVGRSREGVRTHFGIGSTF